MSKKVITPPDDPRIERASATGHIPSDMRGESYDTLPTEVEVERRVFEHRNQPDIVAFRVPDTLKKARSAYCYDPVFRQAIDVFCKEKSPDEALSENTKMMLQIEKRLLVGSESIALPEQSSAGFKRKGNTDPEPKPLSKFKSQFGPETKSKSEKLEDAKKEYVDGEISILTFENRVEKILEN